MGLWHSRLSNKYRGKRFVVDGQLIDLYAFELGQNQDDVAMQFHLEPATSGIFNCRDIDVFVTVAACAGRVSAIADALEGNIEVRPEGVVDVLRKVEASLDELVGLTGDNDAEGVQTGVQTEGGAPVETCSDESQVAARKGHPGNVTITE